MKTAKKTDLFAYLGHFRQPRFVADGHNTVAEKKKPRPAALVDKWNKYGKPRVPKWGDQSGGDPGYPPGGTRPTPRLPGDGGDVGGSGPGNDLGGRFPMKCKPGQFVNKNNNCQSRPPDFTKANRRIDKRVAQGLPVLSQADTRALRTAKGLARKGTLAAAYKEDPGYKKYIQEIKARQRANQVQGQTMLRERRQAARAARR